MLLEIKLMSISGQSLTFGRKSLIAHDGPGTDLHSPLQVLILTKENNCKAVIHDLMLDREEFEIATSQSNEF